MAELSALERAKLSGELAGLTEKLKTNPPVLARIRASARIAEIIKALGGAIVSQGADFEWYKAEASRKSFGDREVWVSEDKFDELKGMVAYFNKRAVKLGVPEMKIEDKGERFVQWWGFFNGNGMKSRIAKTLDVKSVPRARKVGEIERQILAHVMGELPMLSGWKVLGQIDHEQGGNIVKQVGDGEIPNRYLSSASYCEHCNTKRGRTATYIVQHLNGDIKQIGKSCAKDFLGHGNADGIVALAEQLSKFWELVEADEGGDGDGEGGGGGGGKKYTELNVYLAAVSAAIRTWGWKSKAQAAERDSLSSADEAWSVLMGKKDMPEITKQDYEKAQAAIDWAKAIPDAEAKRETFLNNIRVIANAAAFQNKNAGFAAAIIRAYDKTLEKAAEEKAKALKPSQWQGEVGKRSVFKGLKVEKVIANEGQYGTTYIHKFRDGDGNVFTWFSSSGSLDEGKTYDITATVKGHDDYKGVLQTILTRAKAESDAAGSDEVASEFLGNVKSVAGKSSSFKDFVSTLYVLMSQSGFSLADGRFNKFFDEIGWNSPKSKKKMGEVEYSEMRAAAEEWWQKNYG